MKTPSLPWSHRRYARASSFCVSLLLGLACAAAALAESQEASTPFIDRVDINVINVEAFVTDGDGRAVTDLTPDDFELFEDGEKVEITNFFQSDFQPLEERLAADRQLIAGAGRPGESALVPSPRNVPEDQRLNLVVYVDLYHLSPGNRTRVLKELGAFLEDRLYQGDRILTIAHQRNLHLIHPFTQDLHQVIRGIEKVAGMSTNGQVQEAERRRVKTRLVDPEIVVDDARETVRLYIQQQRLEAETSLRTLGTVLRSLGGLPGRRALLYVGDGLEKQPGLDVIELYNQRFSLSRDRFGLEALSNDLSDAIDQVTRAANTYQTTIYTLQARGNQNRGSVNAANDDFSIGISGTLQADASREMAEQEPLIDLAVETGGKAILNTSNFGGALENLAQDFSRLYSLGYRSRTGGDGAYHRIEVKVKRPGLKVRHRSGYVDKPQDQRVADRAYSSLILGVESNPLAARVDFAAAKKEGFGKYHLPLIVRVPLGELTLLPEGDRLKGRLRFFFAVQDPDGAISEVSEVPYPIDIAATDFEQNRGKDIGYALKLAVRPGQPKVSIGIWDEVSGMESYLLRSVAIGDDAAKPKKSR